METNFVTNVHEVVYASFLAKDCPANEVRILSKFYKVAFVVFKAGNVSYNAVMAANTIVTDFFVSNHRLFAREMALEFVENILTLLLAMMDFGTLPIASISISSTFPIDPKSFKS